MTIIKSVRCVGFILSFASLMVLPLRDPVIQAELAARIPDRSHALVAIRSVSVVRAGDKAAGMAAFYLTQDPRRWGKYSRSGGGVIIDPQGIIVTNAHLVQNAAGISVELFNGTRLEGRLLSVLPENDLAFLSVKPASQLSFVPLADSDRLVAGDQVYCIGHALNHKGVLLNGKFRAMLKLLAPRTPPPEFLQIQFGFHLYGGDSGSPILDPKGRLVGLVSGGRRSGDMATMAVAANVIREGLRRLPKF